MKSLPISGFKMSRKPPNLINKIDPIFTSDLPFNVVYDGYGDPPIDNAFKLVNLPHEKFKHLGRVEKYVEQMKYLFWAVGQPQAVPFPLNNEKIAKR
ncbi:37704_t:CDS:2 [Gigaspora margarita]|uniref:Uncharacterized protein n=2 Tax=Gigaspora margarita TaxID=4874 RepID=A0A8H4ASW8_GIGMA|nr:hypothetical protein F8M41_012910 [Gigaspora margarita]CAG8572390.1 37704_t:CDS:2 [Gigaspora margarita]